MSHTRTESGTDTASRISDHLPECPSVNYFGLHERTACICRYLRACEQRVLGDRDEIVGITAVRSFRAGLDAASEAISGLFFLGWAIDRRQALAAIDALKGKP